MRLAPQVLSELSEVIDHEVDLRLLMSEGDQPLLIETWWTHDLVIDRPEE